MISNMGSDLDSLIHSLEYENQQYVKMIEKENQRNEYLQSQEEEKLGVIAELQTCITNLEIETKNSHKQLVHNKNTLESLKKSKCVLQAHKEALLKHLDSLQFENSEQRREFEDTVRMYEKTWKDYEGQYKSLALYQTLREAEQKLAETRSEQLKWHERKKELQGKIKAVQDELDFRDWNRFCIKIAEKRVMTGRKKEELLAAVREKEHLQSKLKEIREKNSSVTATAEDSSQAMEINCSQTEASDKKDERSVTEDEENIRADGKDIADMHADKENICYEQQTTEADTTDATDKTFTLSENCDIRSLTESSLMTVESEVTEGRMEGNGIKDQNSKKANVGNRFEPPRSSTPVDARPMSLTRKPFQLVQLAPIPKIPQQPPTPTVSPVRTELPQRQNSRVPVPTPQIQHLPKRVILPPSTRQSGIAAAPCSKPSPVQLSVPLLSIPKPCSTPGLPTKPPTVQSAVSSILSQARPSTARFPKPATPSLPRIPLPRTPLVPPPSPLLPNRFGRPLDTGRSREEISQTGKSRLPLPVMSSAPSIVVPTLAKKPAQCPSNMPSQVPSLPMSMFPVQGFKEMSSVARTPVVSPELTTSPAGDAPPTQHAEKARHSTGNTLEVGKNGTKSDAEDEEMESDMECQGISQPSASPQKSDGALSQGQSISFSPFSLDKHKQKLMEFNEESDDSFNFEQRHLFQSDDKLMTDNNPHSTSTVNSIFNMTFVTPSSETQEQPMAALFGGMGSKSPTPDPTKPAPNRDSERSGSFFSFESMDTSENNGGLSLLSRFGGASKEAEPEPAFSFSFGGSPVDSGNASAFSFSFGGGGGAQEETTGSMFSLF